MKEAAQTARLLQVLRNGIPELVAIKHADRATIGIPDLSVTWLGTTTWVEIKNVPEFTDPEIKLWKVIKDRRQLRVMGQLSDAAPGKVFYLIYAGDVVLYVEASRAEQSVKNQFPFVTSMYTDPVQALRTGFTAFWTKSDPQTVARIFGFIHGRI